MTSKKIIATILALVLLINTVNPINSHAKASKAMQVTEDVYAINAEEELDIDGISYLFSYSYDENGNRVVEVLDQESNNTYIVTADSITSLSSTETTIFTDDLSTSLSSTPADGKYHKIGKVKHKITWKDAVTAASLAAAIGAAVGISVAAVLSTVGNSTLAGITAGASTAIGSTVACTVNATIYERYVGTKVHTYKYVWSFTASTGEKYGTYTNYVEVGM